MLFSVTGTAPWGIAPSFKVKYPWLFLLMPFALDFILSFFFALASFAPSLYFHPFVI
jgi:hypothetical protein